MSSITIMHSTMHKSEICITRCISYTHYTLLGNILLGITQNLYPNGMKINKITKLYPKGIINIGDIFYIHTKQVPTYITTNQNKQKKKNIVHLQTKM